MNDTTTFNQSLTINLRVIGALLMREIITRYGRHNLGFLWLFLEPMMFTLGVTAIWSYTHANHLGSTLPIAAFTLTGYSTILLWRNMPTRCVSAVIPNLGLMYHRNVVLLDIFVSRIVLEVTAVTASFSTLGILFFSTGLMKAPVDIVPVLIGWMMLAWFGASMSLFVGALGARSEVIEKIWHPISYLTFPLSGAAFMLEWLPSPARAVLIWMPTVNCCEIIRQGFFGPMVHAHYDMSYVAIFNTCLMLLGLAQVRLVAERIAPQ